MSRLYWRIFFAFWLVLILTMVVTVTIHTLLLRGDVAANRLQALSASMDALTEQAQRRLDAEGEAGLRAWLADQEASLPVPLLIIDPSGRELLGRRLPRFLRAPLRSQPNASFSSANRPPHPAPRTLHGPRGDYTLVALRPPSRPWRRLAPSARRLFPLVLILLSGVACFLLARHLTRPIRTFRATGQAIAAGDLSARVGPQVAARKDEFGALARDFDRMATQVEALLQARQRLLRDVSHELRSPLARLQAASGLLRQQANDGDNANLDRIEREVDTLNDMIGQILTFARLDSSEAIRRETTDVGDLLAAVVDDARYEAGPLGRELTLDAPAALWVDLDPRLVQSALENVVRNAVAHSRHLTTVRLRLSSDSVQIIVTDDGPGVADCDLERLFDAFFTAPGATASKRGAGIGLAIAKRAIELHGGSISAANREASSGLEVEITLPR